MKRILILASIAVLAGASFITSAAAPVPDSFADLASRLQPEVVNISTTKVIKGNGRMMQPHGPDDQFRDFFGDEFWRRFFGNDMQEFKTSSLGSGFIWDSDGTIVTNNHVVDNADEIQVRLADGKKFEAKVVGTDPKTDIAVLKIDPKGHTLNAVARGDSDAIRVGDWVVAIGNPFGYGNTITAGIVSAKERVIGSGPYDSFLQTDAAINPGNSGGPLFDIQGRVVGINTAIVSGGTGIGFAIPINMAKDIVAQLKGSGKVTRGWLGVSIQTVTEEIAESMGLDEPAGALVADVIKGGPADKAGLERGDVITRFDDTVIRNKDQLPFVVASHAPGSKVNLDIVRKGKRKTLSTTLGELTAEGEQQALGSAKPSDEQFGMTVQEITPELRSHLDLDATEGLVVTDVKRGSPAAEGGIQRGDVLIEVNQQPVTSLSSLKEALQASPKKESALLLVRRGGNTIYVVVKHPKEGNR
jgi:serine protease Do